MISNCPFPPESLVTSFACWPQISKAAKETARNHAKLSNPGVTHMFLREFAMRLSVNNWLLFGLCSLSPKQFRINIGAMADTK